MLYTRHYQVLYPFQAPVKRVRYPSWWGNIHHIHRSNTRKNSRGGVIEPPSCVLYPVEGVLYWRCYTQFQVHYTHDNRVIYSCKYKKRFKWGDLYDVWPGGSGWRRGRGWRRRKRSFHRYASHTLVGLKQWHQLLTKQKHTKLVYMHGKFQIRWRVLRVGGRG